MEIKQFKYVEDRNLKALKQICVKTGSKALKKTFEYLRILFYFTNPEKVIAEYIPDTAYYVATANREHLRIVDIGVAKDYQQRGIGKSLLKRIYAHARHRKLNKITLRTSSEETAFMFYEKQGFKIVGTTGEDLEMEKQI